MPKMVYESTVTLAGGMFAKRHLGAAVKAKSELIMKSQSDGGIKGI